MEDESNKERRKDAGQLDQLVSVGGREVDPACGAGWCPGLNFAAGVTAGVESLHLLVTLHTQQVEAQSPHNH